MPDSTARWGQTLEGTCYTASITSSSYAPYIRHMNFLDTCWLKAEVPPRVDCLNCWELGRRHIGSLDTFCLTTRAQSLFSNIVVGVFIDIGCIKRSSGWELNDPSGLISTGSKLEFGEDYEAVK